MWQEYGNWCYRNKRRREGRVWEEVAVSGTTDTKEREAVQSYDALAMDADGSDGCLVRVNKVRDVIVL